jgi:hypothetical protein
MSLRVGLRQVQEGVLGVRGAVGEAMVRAVARATFVLQNRSSAHGWHALFQRFRV